MSGKWGLNEDAGAAIPQSASLTAPFAQGSLLENEAKEKGERSFFRMGYYEDICDRLIKDAQRITEGHGFYTEYFIGIEETDGKHSGKISTQKVEPYFFDAILKVARKLLDLLNEKETKKTEQSFGIKGERDKALMNLYKHYNRITALEDIDYTTLESMHILIDSIEKLEHARHMEASDEIAKITIEKLEKLATPIPEMRMSGIPKEFRAVLDKCEKKEGAENDD